MTRFSAFFGELKRRKVFRVGLLYLIAAWLIIQVVDVIFPALQLSDWTITLVVALLIIGFPIALVLAWAYEVKPETSTVAAVPEAAGDSASVITAVSDASKSIVVLPFVNMSSDEENEYFSDGMTEEIINALTQLKDLHVVASTSSFAFKGKTTSIDEIGRKLNVTTVLEGSVRKVDNRLRITAQLINAADGFHLWSEKYDREAGDIFAIQDEISLAIVDKLKVKLISQEKTRLIGKATRNPAAHQAYLKGRYFWNQRGAGLKKAVDYFELALAEDENYATAYSGLADAYSLLGFYGYLPPKEVMPKAKKAAQKALEIDESLAEAHCSLGYVHTIFEWEWEKARKEFLRALELNPRYGPAREWYSVWLWFMGHLEEAIAEVRHGLETDPLSVYAHVQLGCVLLSAQKFEQASQQLLQALDLVPDFSSARSFLGLAYFYQSRVEEAIREIQIAIDMSHRDQWPVAFLGVVYAAIGDRIRADEILLELKDRAQNEYIHAYWIAAIYAMLNEKDKAFDWLEKAFNDRNHIIGASALKTYPGWFFNNLRDDSRFQDLLRRLGLDKIG
jgi:TolB-like protein/Flp pilus assembly protein TadD